RRTCRVIRAGALRVRHREHVTRCDIEQDGHAALRVRARDTVRQHLLGLVLESVVDGQNEVAAPLRLPHLSLAPGKLAALGVALDLEHASLPGKPVVVLGLQPREPVVVRPDEAEHRAGQRSVRIEPLRFGDEIDTGEPQRLDLHRGGAVDLASDVYEPLGSLGETIAQRRLVDANDGRELCCVRGRVLHDARVRPDRLLWHGRGEIVAVTIEHAATFGGEVHGSDALVQAELLVALTTDRLEVDETRADDDEDDHQRREERDQAASCRARTWPPRAQLLLTLSPPFAVMGELITSGVVGGAPGAAYCRREAVVRDPVHRVGGVREGRPQALLASRRLSWCRARSERLGAPEATSRFGARGGGPCSPSRSYRPAEARPGLEIRDPAPPETRPARACHARV